MSMLHSMSILHSVSMLHVHVYVHVHIGEMPDCPVMDRKKLTMPEQVRYWTKLTQSGIFLVRYRTTIWDADAGVSFLDADTQLCSL
jgi:hypothetical protein